jgi:tryptophan-rich sensory protein
MRRWLSLLAFLALVSAVAAFGAQFEPGAWYAALRKPPLTPPNWIFAPVWSLLYLANAAAAWLVWCAPSARGPWLELWIAQLALNAAWSFLFFGLQRADLALLEIVVLLAAVLATAAAFRRASAAAAALLLPYAAWVAFAAYLNAGIWLLNR